MAAPKFSLQLREFARKTDERKHAIVRKIVLDVGTSVVMRSPVGNPELWQHPAPAGYVGGRFRANWQYGNYSGAGIPTSMLSDIDPSGQASTARIAASVPERAAGMVHVLVNNLPYAMRLETGWSKQAPGGMVGLAVREFQDTVRRAAEAIR